MIIVQVNKERGIESALKSFKFKTQKTKLIQEIRKRHSFEKDSISRRNEINKAIYREKKNGLD